MSFNLENFGDRILIGLLDYWIPIRKWNLVGKLDDVDPGSEATHSILGQISSNNWMLPHLRLSYVGCRKEWKGHGQTIEDNMSDGLVPLGLGRMNWSSGKRRRNRHSSAQLL